MKWYKKALLGCGLIALPNWSVFANTNDEYPNLLGDNYAYKVESFNDYFNFEIKVPGDFDVSDPEARDRVAASAVTDYVSRQHLLKNVNNFIDNLERTQNERDKRAVVEYLKVQYNKLTMSKKALADVMGVHVKENTNPSYPDHIIKTEETVERQCSWWEVICHIFPTKDIPVYKLVVNEIYIKQGLSIAANEIFLEVFSYDKMVTSRHLLQDTFGETVYGNFISALSSDVSQYDAEYNTSAGLGQPFEVDYGFYYQECMNLTRSNNDMCNQWLDSLHEKVRISLTQTIQSEFQNYTVEVNGPSHEKAKLYLKNITIEIEKRINLAAANKAFLDEIRNNGFLVHSDEYEPFPAELLGEISEEPTAHVLTLSLTSPLACTWNEPTQSYKLATKLALNFKSEMVDSRFAERLEEGKVSLSGDPCKEALLSHSDKFHFTVNFPGDISSYINSPLFKSLISRLEPDVTNDTEEVVAARGSELNVPLIEFSPLSVGTESLEATLKIAVTQLGQNQCKYELLDVSQIDKQKLGDLASIFKSVAQDMPDAQTLSMASKLDNLTRGMSWQDQGEIQTCRDNKLIKYTLGNPQMLVIRAMDTANPERFYFWAYNARNEPQNKALF